MNWIRNFVGNKNEEPTRRDSTVKPVVEHKQLASGSLRVKNTGSLGSSSSKYTNLMKIVGLFSSTKAIGDTAQANQQALAGSSLTNPVESKSPEEEAPPTTGLVANWTQELNHPVNCDTTQPIVTEHLSAGTQSIRKSAKSHRAPLPPSLMSSSSASVGDKIPKAHKESPKKEGQEIEELKKTPLAEAMSSETLFNSDDRKGYRTVQKERPDIDEVTEGIGNLIIDASSTHLLTMSGGNELKRENCSEITLATLNVLKNASSWNSVDISTSEDISRNDNSDLTYTKIACSDSAELNSSTFFEIDQDIDDPQKFMPFRDFGRTALNTNLRCSSEEIVALQRTVLTDDAEFRHLPNKHQQRGHLPCPAGDKMNQSRQSLTDIHEQFPLPLDPQDDAAEESRNTVPKKRKSPDPHRLHHKRQNVFDSLNTTEQQELFSDAYSHTFKDSFNIDVVRFHDHENTVKGDFSKHTSHSEDSFDDAPVGGPTQDNQNFVDSKIKDRSQRQEPSDRRSPESSSKFDKAHDTDARTARKKVDEDKNPANQGDEFVQCTLEKIGFILAEVRELQEEINSFPGTETSDRDYVYMAEVMLRNVIKLDDIDTKNKREVRERRKKGVQFIQSMMTQLDKKLRENQEKMEKKPEDTPANSINGDEDKQGKSSSFENDSRNEEDVLSEVVMQK